MEEFRCTDPEKDWIEDQRHNRESRLLSMAIGWEKQYRADPTHTYAELVSEFGRDDANTIVRWIESLARNEKLRLDPNDTPNAA